MASGPRGSTVAVVHDETPERCWMCDSPAHTYLFDCPECTRRWEDTECRELRERLFPVSAPEPLPE
jgi:hypothetical protein